MDRPENDLPWHRDPRRRGEVVIVVAFVSFSLAIPLTFRELYPFSIAPMFSDAPQFYFDYAVLGPDGRSLPLVDFQLQRNYWGNPPDLGHGIRPPETLDRFGQAPDPDELTRHVERRLANFPDLPFVDLVVERVGALDDQRVGIVERHQWRVSNPLSPAAKRPAP